MKYFLTQFTNSRGVKRCAWQGTASDAIATRVSMQQAHEDVRTVEFDVPTDRLGLLEFLNKYATGELK